MPWHIEKSGDKYNVVKGHSNTTGGRKFGSHDSKAKAAAQLRALYASESKKG